MSLELSLVIVALLLFAYAYVWSNPIQEKQQQSKVIDRRWHVRDRPEGGFFIFVEVL